MRILMTGANSFVGKSILKEIEYQNNEFNQSIEVMISPRDLLKLPSGYGKLDFIITTDQDFLNVDSEVPPFSHVLHLANTTKLFETSTTMSEILKINYGWIDILKKYLSRNSQQAKFMYSSSGAVYGDLFKKLPNRPIEESVAFDTDIIRSQYGKAKYLTENYILENVWGEDIQTLNFRLFTFYGHPLPLDSNYLIVSVVNAIIKKQVLELESNGATIRSYFPSKLMAKSMIKLAQTNFSGAVNIGSSRGLSVRNLADLCQKEFGLDYVLNKYSISESYYVPDTKLLESLIEIEPEESLAEGLREWISQI